LDKPDRLFGRNAEWAELSDFAASPRPGASLGLVYGRRRQGKTLMLELLAQRARGFIFAATQQSETQTLADLGASYAAFAGLRQPVVFASWREALAELLRIGEQEPLPVILDEFPYLLSVSPGLPSYLQQALNPLGRAKEASRTRLILCGSALSVMSRLLDRGAPLRGRAVLELVLRPFGYREAASFWGLDNDPELAFRVHALVGGTPAYLEMCDGTRPDAAAEFDAWVGRRLLNPASAMFREGRQLLREEPSITDATSYAALLTAISSGCHRRSEMAAALGRPASSLSGLLDGLEDIGLVERTDDALRDRRSVFTVAEPIVRLHQLIIGRREPELVAGRSARVWASAADTVSGRIYGPHFEYLAREWCFLHAAPATIGGIASHVRPTEIACRHHRQTHELDVVVTEMVAFGKDRITAIGEAKGTSTPVGVSELERLEHVRGLLPADRVTRLPKIILVALAGFTSDLVTTARGRSDVELVDADRLYHGS
jgi:hypothetical protein